MTSQGPQLTPPGGVHLLRLPGGAPFDPWAAEPPGLGHGAMNPFAGPGPGLILPAASLSPSPHMISGSGTVLQPNLSGMPPAEPGGGDWALPVIGFVIIAAVLVRRLTRR